MATLRRNLVEQLIFGVDEASRRDGAEPPILQRFTQDSPVQADVWIRYADKPNEPHDLLLEPKRGTAPARLAMALGALLDRDECEVAYNETRAVAKLQFEHLIRSVLPMSSWWDTHVFPEERAMSIADLVDVPLERVALLLAGTPEPARRGRRGALAPLTEDARWLLNLVGVLQWAAASDGPIERLPEATQYAGLVVELLRPLAKKKKKNEEKQNTRLIWAVSLNRRAAVSIWQSTSTVKADAARAVFTVKCDDLCWAVLDTGIDATHPAFRVRERGELARLDPKKPWNRATRVDATYDFTRVRELFNPHSAAAAEMEKNNPKIKQFRKELMEGRPLDWSWLEADDTLTFRIPHDRRYRVPVHPHGTHVAGILAGDWRRKEPGYDESDDYDLVGLCPDLRLIDLRVLGDDGRGNEFAVIAALQFLQYLNRSRRTVHGCNLSLSIPHDVANYACGRTPVCEEATRLVANGVVTVAAAGNLGYVKYLTNNGESDAYRNISITDPGNAEAVITVGSVHRNRPHSYGVSYFSSRGPTGDGRIKPDFVAPGEKIKGPAPGQRASSFDGTSQAAPHVSGAAAMLMARHRELVGEAATIKSILAKTATDLGRERYFQGGGLIDILRALQSV